MWLVKIRPMLCEMVFYVEDFGDRCDTPISTFSSIVAHSVCDRKFDPIFSLRLDTLRFQSDPSLTREIQSQSSTFRSGPKITQTQTLS